MARTAITVITPSITAAALGAAGTENAGDVSNGHFFAPAPSSLLIARNSGASTRVVTIKSPTPDGYGRTIPDVTKSLLAGESWAWRVPDAGFKQSDGTIWVDVAHAEVRLQLFV
jgi:hypothetical protein